MQNYTQLCTSVKSWCCVDATLYFLLYMLCVICGQETHRLWVMAEATVKVQATAFYPVISQSNATICEPGAHIETGI